ncbi:DUF4112 domain-containing protein [Prevotella lacticifex]|uniref:DUF4112 domain-containing protein n=1 Tax=Prevotella lacticifex TaxID=2854755 RepID=A0A9R1C8K2_9BACT|nr:DUF4112 domain-containing protein [Prevotella lacticifex]GJG37963.1 hypothetical protein PRLR5003_31200 [Prevotella lacticifex]GJG41081.1 hypothetical protein PRLR5019_30520 [Prevotella lacticifex]GJG43446.1 hypothetical protein PRLR5025_22320 [Prevotella lacticifex]GJG47228.1 hypothetical protein PRLR5027_28230 [Prevotella lacticifex]GJG50119.1 hypothetical protein PRLR5052_25320 [Prevotella lacticifex]
MTNSRRQQAQADMGMNIQREEQQREKTLAREQQRQAEKEAKREELMNTAAYRVMDMTAKYMDKYFLDPLIGLLPGGVGDVLSSFLALPFIYFALVRVKSIPLTLAVICNILKDALLGSLPFFIGDVIDVFNRSYISNLKLITGYVNDDRAVIREVNRKAFWSAVLIVVLCVLIYFVVKWTIELADWFISLF